jgi:CRISPR type III-A-associated protein Csm2
MSEEAKPQQQQQQPQQKGNRPPRENRDNKGPRPDRGGDRPRGENRDNRDNRGGGQQRDQRGGGGDYRGGGDRDRRNFEAFQPDIDYDKLLADPLYLDNQAHVVVARMRDMDTATRSQLRRLYSAVRRAVRAADSERQHEFVMLRARLAYTIARHSLRSLDTLEKLLLQVTRKNELRGYERFRDLFEAIIAYNE